MIALLDARSKLWPVSRTPQSWRHVRLCETDDDEFAIRFFYTHGDFGPMALIALGVDGNTKTEGLDLSTALKLGAVLDKALIDINSDRTPRKRVRD